VQVDAGGLTGRIRALPCDRIIGGNRVSHSQCQSARGQFADWVADRRWESSG
jgi:hypothetical protein